jgi:hypothetical protein
MFTSQKLRSLFTSSLVLKMPLLAALLTATACSSSHSPSLSSASQLPDTNPSGKQQIQDALTITDSSGIAIAGAQVLIGTGLNTPFTGNFLTTSASGQVAFPSAWTTAQPITIQATGFVRTTFMAQMPTAQTFKLRPQPSSTQLLVTGQTTGFGDLQNDGNLNVGIVFPGFSRQNLMSFQLSDVISPVNDQISIAGQNISLPSNVTLPQQTQTYIFFPITFNKPQYRFFVSQTGTYSMVAERAQLPFQKIVQAASSGQSLMDSINDIQFVSASVQNVPVGAQGVSIDLPVNKISFNSSIQVVAPAIDSAHMVLSIALASQNSLLYPSDIKRLSSGQSQSLTYPSTGTAGTVLSVLATTNITSQKGAAAEQMSLTFSPTNQSQSLEFLPVIAAPQVQGSVLTAKLPQVSSQTLADAPPLMTYACQSTVNGNELTPEWDIFAPGWIASIQMPTWPTAKTSEVLQTSNQRWELTYAAGKVDTTQMSLGGSLLGSATHLTRSAIDL